jgi:hypothetical protein
LWGPIRDPRYVGESLELPNAEIKRDSRKKKVKRHFSLMSFGQRPINSGSGEED